MTQQIAAVLAGATLVAALIVCIGMLATDARAQDTRTVTRTINDRPYQWTLPEAGCALLRAWEDGSSTAWCADGLHRYDPENRTWYSVTTSR